MFPRTTPPVYKFYRSLVFRGPVSLRTLTAKGTLRLCSGQAPHTKVILRVEVSVAENRRQNAR
jgi:hypothetical protein